MKLLLRSIAVHTLALYLLQALIQGVTITGGIVTFLFAGIMFTILRMVVKPILNVITFPFNIITFGLFSIVTNALLLYLLTVFVTGIMIRPFTFTGADLGGFIIPAIAFSTLFTFLTASMVLSAIVVFIQWLID